MKNLTRIAQFMLLTKATSH